MTTIELRFPTGKWHATPWGRQVNEGAVEWPPAPWRTLRALLAVWHHKFHDVGEDEIRSLIEALSPLPSYYLPPTSEGHTRHYMPVANDARTKIFDTFIVLSPKDPVVICWPDVVLDESQRQLLSDLLQAMTYFGRAESWVQAELGMEPPEELNARPLNGAGVGNSQELVRLLAPTSVEEYGQWRSQAVEEMRDRKLSEKREKAISQDKPPEKAKLEKKDLQKIDNSISTDLFAALHADTNDLRSAGWNRPPGSRWTDYIREKQLEPLPTGKLSKRKKCRPTVARFAVASAVRPRLTEAIWIGERARQAIMSRSEKENGGNCSTVFLGRATDGTPSRDEAKAHSHAHYLCESTGINNRGRITHLTIFAPDGFSDADEKALSRFNKMWGHGGHDLQLVLLGTGQPEDFGGTNEKKGESPILASSNVWISRTPFVPADRLRRQYRLDDETERHRCELDLKRIIRAEFRRRPWLKKHLDHIEIEAIFDRGKAGTMLGGTRTSWLKFRRERKKGGGRRGSAHGYGFRLRFNEPVRGPIVLGYGSHFGLGQFVPPESVILDNFQE